MLAVVIMALVSVIAYRGLAAMLAAREQITSENTRFRDLAQAMTRIDADFSAVVDRPIRDSYGVEKAAFLGAPDGLEEAGAAVVLTRMGAPAQIGKLADLQRLGYRVKEGRLELLAWPALDQAPRATPSASTAPSARSPASNCRPPARTRLVWRSCRSMSPTRRRHKKRSTRSSWTRD